MANASHDQNHVPSLLGASCADGKTPVNIYADPATHRLLVNATGGGGTPAGVNGDIQVNLAGAFGVISGARLDTTGGTRGACALDLQSKRTSGAFIACGCDSITIGQNINNVLPTALCSMGIGWDNTILTPCAIAVGQCLSVDTGCSVFGSSMWSGFIILHNGNLSNCNCAWTIDPSGNFTGNAAGASFASSANFASSALTAGCANCAGQADTAGCATGAGEACALSCLFSSNINGQGQCLFGLGAVDSNSYCTMSNTGASCTATLTCFCFCNGLFVGGS